MGTKGLRENGPRTAVKCVSDRGESGYFGHAGKFGHTIANSENPDETAHNEPSHQDFHCLPSYFCFNSKQLAYKGNNVTVRIYPTLP